MNITSPWTVLLLSFLLPALAASSPARAEEADTEAAGTETRASIEVLSLSPDPDSVVDPDTEIRVRLRYRINHATAKPKRYFAQISFAGHAPDTWVWRSVEIPNAGRRRLGKLEGEVTLVYLLAHIYGYERLGAPLRASVEIFEKTGPYSRTVVGRTDAIPYHSASIPR